MCKDCGCGKPDKVHTHAHPHTHEECSEEQQHECKTEGKDKTCHSHNS